MRRAPDEQLASGLGGQVFDERRGHVVLANVYAIALGEKREIGPIVGEEQATCFARDGPKGAEKRERSPGTGVLRPQLNTSGTGERDGASGGDHVDATGIEQGHIEDGVETSHRVRLAVLRPRASGRDKASRSWVGGPKVAILDGAA